MTGERHIVGEAIQILPPSAHSRYYLGEPLSSYAKDATILVVRVAPIFETEWKRLATKFIPFVNLVDNPAPVVVVREADEIAVGQGERVEVVGEDTHLPDVVETNAENVEVMP